MSTGASSASAAFGVGACSKPTAERAGIVGVDGSRHVLRRRLLAETRRYRMVAASALDLGWLDRLREHAGKPVLFIAEGVFMYFADAETQGLALRERFPGAELVFDVASPLVMRLQNLELRRGGSDVRMRWSLRRDDRLEQWAPGIRLLEAWHYTSLREFIARLRNLRILARPLPPLCRGMAILRYVL
jgi:O-methyltransferase involved in polyketide biosynthesis